MYHVWEVRHRPTDWSVRERRRATEALKTEARGAALSLSFLFLSLSCPLTCVLSCSLPLTAIFPFEGRRVQLPSRSCYHCDWLRRTATAGAKAGAPPCAGRRLCVLLIGQHGHVAPYHPSPPHSANRRTKYQRIYRPRAPHFVCLQIRARALVPTGLQPPPCYRSCSLASSSSFPMDLRWSTGCTTDFQRRCLRARGCPGIAAPSLRDNARRHDQGMHFHSVDVVSVNLITHRQYLYLQLCLIAVLINEYSPFLFDSSSICLI